MTEFIDMSGDAEILSIVGKIEARAKRERIKKYVTAGVIGLGVICGVTTAIVIVKNNESDEPQK